MAVRSARRPTMRTARAWRSVARHALQRRLVDQVHHEHHVAVGRRFAVAVAHTLDTGNLAQQARRVQCRLLDDLAADFRAALAQSLHA